MTLSTEKEIKKFIADLDEELTIVFSDECSYEESTETIYYSDKIDEYYDLGFMRHVIHVHNFLDAQLYGIKLLSLLHEIGHHFTLYYCEDDSMSRFICQNLSDTEILDPKYQDIYYNIEAEWEATEWAIQFIRENKELCKRLTRLLNE